MSCGVCGRDIGDEVPAVLPNHFVACSDCFDAEMAAMAREREARQRKSDTDLIVAEVRRQDRALKAYADTQVILRPRVDRWKRNQ